MIMRGKAIIAHMIIIIAFETSIFATTDSNMCVTYILLLFSNAISIIERIEHVLA